MDGGMDGGMDGWMEGGQAASRCGGGPKLGFDNREGWGGGRGGGARAWHEQFVAPAMMHALTTGSAAEAHRIMMGISGSGKIFTKPTPVRTVRCTRAGGGPGGARASGKCEQGRKVHAGGAGAWGHACAQWTHRGAQYHSHHCALKAVLGAVCPPTPNHPPTHPLINPPHPPVNTHACALTHVGQREPHIKHHHHAAALLLPLLLLQRGVGVRGPLSGCGRRGAPTPAPARAPAPAPAFHGSLGDGSGRWHLGRLALRGVQQVRDGRTGSAEVVHPPRKGREQLLVGALLGARGHELHRARRRARRKHVGGGGGGTPPVAKNTPHCGRVAVGDGRTVGRVASWWRAACRALCYQVNKTPVGARAAKDSAAAPTKCASPTTQQCIRGGLWRWFSTLRDGTQPHNAGGLCDRSAPRTQQQASILERGGARHRSTPRGGQLRGQSQGPPTHFE
jgi:hypothetical protein